MSWALEKTGDEVPAPLLPGPTWRWTSPPTLLAVSYHTEGRTPYLAVVGGYSLGYFALGSVTTGLLTAGAMGVAAAVPALVRATRRWLTRRRFQQTPLAVPDARRGEQCRFKGVVALREASLSTLTGPPAVLTRFLGARGVHNQRAWQHPQFELHAVDFALVLDDGTSLLIDSRAITLLPSPPTYGREVFGDPIFMNMDLSGLCMWIYREEVVCPGLQVEVVGTFERLPDPSAAAGSDRSTRLVPALVGHPGAPVMVRLQG